MHESRMGWAPLALLIAAEHERSAQVTASTPRFTCEEQEQRRRLDVPPSAAVPLLSGDALLDWADTLLETNDDAREYLVSKLRGGCNCCVSPPCFNCTEPVNTAEAEDLLERFGDEE